MSIVYYRDLISSNKVTPKATPAKSSFSTLPFVLSQICAVGYINFLQSYTQLYPQEDIKATVLVLKLDAHVSAHFQNGACRDRQLRMSTPHDAKYRERVICVLLADHMLNPYN